MIKRVCLLYFFVSPADLIGALLVFVLAPFQKTGLGIRIEHRPTGPWLWALSLDLDRLPGTRRAMMIAPHVIFFRSGCHLGQGWSVLQEREHKRSELHEATGLTGFVFALVGFALGTPWWAALLLWAAAPWLFALAGHVVTWLRGDGDHGAHSDKASYALSAEVSKH